MCVCVSPQGKPITQQHVHGIGMEFHSLSEEKSRMELYKALDLRFCLSEFNLRFIEEPHI